MELLHLMHLYHCHPVAHQFAQSGTNNVSIVRLVVSVFGISNTPQVACQALLWELEILGRMLASPRGMEESNLGWPHARQMPYLLYYRSSPYILISLVLLISRNNLIRIPTEKEHNLYTFMVPSH